MKQIIQSLKNGSIELIDVPIPKISSKSVLVKSSYSLISSGTEKMLINFGKANLFKKAQQQPDKVKMVFDKIKSDGLAPTLKSVSEKINQPLPLGYCNFGKIVEVGDEVTEFYVGDRVISNGKHAEFVNIPVNLCCKVPDNVSDEEAPFTVLGSVALQSIRLLKPTLGESIVVIGLGLVGLLTVQLLQANGCRVLGVDQDIYKLNKAKELGIDVVDISKNEDPVKVAISFTRGRGADGVIISASTESNEPIHQAAKMSRKRGRIILVGVSGLKISRDDFYKKELTFQVSSSYGPGRYDPAYEEKGLDYPFEFVRWTEKRNFEAVLDMISLGKINLKLITSHIFDIDEAKKAYSTIFSESKSLGVLLKYNTLNDKNQHEKIMFKENDEVKINFSESISVSSIGAGNFASSKLLPNFKKNKASFRLIASASGLSSSILGKKFKFKQATSDISEIFKDSKTEVVLISTRHNTHSNFVLNALKAGKHVFVEKPLSLKLDDLENIKKAMQETDKKLMVGFNRRFSPQIKKIKQLLSISNYPKSIIITVNAGYLPDDHWAQDREVGGGRIVGEACHFIDLLRFLTGHKIVSYNKKTMSSKNNDTVSLNFNFEDGSIGTVHYFSNGPKSMSKERLEIFSNGSVLQLDNFKKLKGYNWPGFKKMNLWLQDKGHHQCIKEFVHSIRNGLDTPIPLNEIIEVSKISIELEKSF